jgi:DNA-nicking Smr family endonuclease
MDFGNILDDWEKLSAKPGGLEKASEAEKQLREEDSLARRKATGEAKARKAGKGQDAHDSLAAWLDSHAVDDKDARSAGRGDEGSAFGGAVGGSDADARSIQAAREAESRRLAAKRPEASLDLHGMRAEEAEAALAAFLEASARKGLEKVLVITGKGIHSQGEPVLGKAARRAIEASPWAGRFGVADAASGGGGALWVILKKGLISRGR